MVIGGQPIHRAILNLEGNANLLPFTVYEKLGLGELRSTKIILQLLDRPTRLYRDVIEDVFIKVGDFIFPINFNSLMTLMMWIILPLIG